MNSKLHLILENLLDSDQVLSEPSSIRHYGADWTTSYSPNPSAVVFPNSTEDVARIVRLANQRGFSLVPSGGRTGLSGGAVAEHGEVVVSFERMNEIVGFNKLDQTVRVQAGVVTQDLQDFADQEGYYFPIDFASRGSSQIGGNLATNAGGIKVIRYGLTRNWASGLTVVTGKGDTLNLNRGLIKNATGYDLRHLFIGSEGTLGLITEAEIRLAKKPQNPVVVLLAVENLEDALEVSVLFREKFELQAFEFFSRDALRHVTAASSVRAPTISDTNYYLVVEVEARSNRGEDTLIDIFEESVQQGLVEDGVIGTSRREMQDIWALRENITESISRHTPYKNDISVLVSKIPELVRRVDQAVSAVYPDFQVVWFGHIGDGNLHVNVLRPLQLPQTQFYKYCSSVNEQIYEIVGSLAGSIAAEHGVGLLKKPFLGHSRSREEISYMKAIKSAFDPNGVMNPGKIFE